MKTIFFDLDGTLTNSKKGIINALKQGFSKIQQPAPADSVLQLFIGPALTDSLKQQVGITDPAIIKTFIAGFHAYYSDKGWAENEVYPGIMTLLKTLKAADYQLAIATAKPESFAKRISAHFGFDAYLAELAAATDDEITRTQKADVLAYGMTQLNLTNPEDVAMVGDRNSDIHGGQVNATKTVGVLYGFGSETELTQAGADILVPTVAELQQVLLDWRF
ncbi:haloacid dehalogenase [Agrilactobacillus composti DSM 18527 = JCM 14202]|uniref:Haloacid dehalogenase n=1 Tax=Agrilactobacillus composti DSM 18527 = JCM 14202 TaxID=1423734 RepID=X0QJ66_9LACO|nr:HAD hydrolase-like protein [Agrilactobacillus composti]KRM34794.1 haloacid dehalogenase [Agrilactobacillus composti DSM 18527 = JCM 14202]GAF38645.1 phosphoglycolate phosphatase [Agrilactobacillus composti DSM 18527 = JCM 14202]